MARYLFLFLVASALGIAQVAPGRYIVELAAPPQLSVDASARQVSAAAAAGQRQRFAARLDSMGLAPITAYELVANGVAVEMSESEAARVAQMPEVKAVHEVYRRRMSLDRAMSIHRVAEALQAAGISSAAGAGMKIGIIDSGIDSAHPGFRDPGLVVPEGYPKFRRPEDKDATTNKVIAARSYDDLYGVLGATNAIDREGHGTGVAMAAAGANVRANYAQVSGVASKAFLGAYRVFPWDEEFATDDVILRAIEDAIRDGMDVINLSLGSSLSSRTVDGLYRAAFDLAADAGVIVVAAAGNEGPGIATVSSPGYLPNVLSVGATWNDRTFRFPVEAGTDRFFGQPGNGPNSSSAIAGRVNDVRRLDTSGLACQSLPADSLAGRIALIDRGTCNFETKLDFARQAGAIAAIVVNNVNIPTVIPMSVGAAKLPAMMISRADGVTLRASLTLDANLNVRALFDGEPVRIENRQMASFSSRGPTPYVTQKPDLVAVGAQFYTATINTNPNSDLYDGSGWMSIQGTSFSSPLVAGAAAVLKAYRPGLTPEAYRSILASSAEPFSSSVGIAFRPVDAGAGLLNLSSALRSTITASTTGVALTKSDPEREIRFTNLAAEPVTLALAAEARTGVAAQLAETSITLPANGTASARLRLPDGLAAGDHQGVLSVTGGPVPLRVPYWMSQPSGVADSMLLLDQDPVTPRPGAIVTMYFRVLESTGHSVESEDVKAAGITEGLTIESLDFLGARFAGTYRLRVRTAPLAGLNRVAVTHGEFRQVIAVEAR